MEEITTIFVVGFPDDMNEREFQNMFIFNPGFEAATLKIPTPNKDGRKQIVNILYYISLYICIYIYFIFYILSFIYIYIHIHTLI